jgi:hypothetical protein
LRSFSTYRFLRSAALFAAVLAGVNGAEGSAIYFSTGEATLQFLTIEHAGGGTGVNISGDAVSCPCVEEFTGGAFADQSVDADLSSATLLNLSSSANGSATDGQARSSSRIEGFFQIDNQSLFEVTAFFVVSASIFVQSEVESGLGSALAIASLDLSSTTDGFLERQSVRAELPGGTNESSFFFLGRVFSMEVQPGFDEFFTVSLRTEGSTTAVPVSEPVNLFSLALGLATAALGARRASHQSF